MTITKCLAGAGMLLGFFACGTFSRCLAGDAETAPPQISAMPKPSGTSTPQAAETHARATPDDRPTVTRESHRSDMLARIGSCVAVVIAAASMIVAYKQLAAARKVNLFAVIARVQGSLGSEPSRDRRRLLHFKLANYLGNSVRDILGEEYVVKVESHYQVDVRAVLRGLQPGDSLNRELLKRLRGANGLLGAVEGALGDFNMIAIPVHLKVKAALEVGRAWEPVLERTAPLLIPFIAVQRQLRDDPDYMKHYIFLLRKLNIRCAELDALCGTACERDGDDPDPS